MTARTALETVRQAIDDFDNIRAAIIGHRIEVPYGTPTADYASLISQINVGFVSGAALNYAVGGIVDTANGFCEETANGFCVEAVSGLMTDIE
ncbi:MAG: hypothetical protein IIT42_04170 [Clostridia bacterium]|nr:hypothetical protein [Clostridia bacterium]